MGKFEEIYQKFKDVKLESISLFLMDSPLFGANSITTFLNIENFHYKWSRIDKSEELLMPRAWDMPEVFRKTLVPTSGFQLNEIKLAQQLAEAIRYNFSNGQQISAQEILRHPLAKSVPLHLLPQVYNKIENKLVPYLPFAQIGQLGFKSQSLVEVEVVIADLFHKILSVFSRQEIDLYLQTFADQSKALKIRHLDFFQGHEFDWRVTIEQRAHFQAEFKLINQKNEPFYLFDSFALLPDSQGLLLYSWKNEFDLLSDQLLQLMNFEMSQVPKNLTHFDLFADIQFKKILRFLKGRKIPLNLGSEKFFVPENKYKFLIHIDENKKIDIELSATLPNDQHFFRKGFSESAEQVIQTMSEGLAYFLKAEAKDLASPQASKREWDLKLLKHTGIIQYITFECFHVLYNEELSDGRIIEKTELLEAISENIKSILLLGPGTSFVKDRLLSELCSKSVLVYLQSWIDFIFSECEKPESFFTSEGEVTIENFCRNELRIVFELQKKVVFETRSEVFKRARSSFFEMLNKNAGSLVDLLAALQNLIKFNFVLHYNNKPIQELEDDQIKVDFVLESIFDEKKNFNWFELNPQFFLDGQAVDPEQFLAGTHGGIIEYKGQVYLLKNQAVPSLRRLQFFWNRLQVSEKPKKKKSIQDRIYQIPKNQTLDLLALRASGIQIRGDHEWKKLCDFYDQLGNTDRQVEVPIATKADLKIYQKFGVNWLLDLYQLKLGALLADDMGLGKTLQALTFLDVLRSRQELGQVLVVVPSSLVFNWQFEIQKFTPEIPFHIFSAKFQDQMGRIFAQQEPAVIITTYGLLMEHDQFFDQYKWKTIVFDEAQNLKNITTKRTAAARSLQAQFKICLTGTPMENHYGEFYSLMDILVPGSLGPLDKFRRQFVNTNVITSEQMSDLKLKMKPLILRRTKKEILDQLPEKQESKISIAFEPKQKEIYRDIALSYNQQIQDALQEDPETNEDSDAPTPPVSDGSGKVQLQMLTALLRLRQVCSDPGALPNVEYKKVPPKIETLAESLEEIISAGESALVFTQFIQTLQRTDEVLTKMNIPHFVLHGGMNSKQRQDTLSQFQNTNGGAVLVMTLKTGGVGLNLTKASYVFHLEPWWNPSVENQATDRVHRLGQKKSVQVFKYIMHESLEEKIEVLKERKDIKFQALFSEEESAEHFNKNTQGLSKSDFDYLISTK